MPFNDFKKALLSSVFIADVSYFVKANSNCDVEGQRRATTVYLADRRYDMLPAVLSANICSLLSGVDRYAMSVLWELDATTYVVSTTNILKRWAFPGLFVFVFIFFIELHRQR